MTKKKHDISDYVTAHVAAQLLTIKHGRKIRPGYVNRIKNIQRIRVNRTLSLYLKSDVEQVQLRAPNASQDKSSNDQAAS